VTSVLELGPLNTLLFSPPNPLTRAENQLSGMAQSAAQPIRLPGDMAPPAVQTCSVALCELLNEVGIEEKALNVQCSESDLDFIAQSISLNDWGTYARALGLSGSLLDDVKED